MDGILARLVGGDLRSEGRAAEVAREVIDDPATLPTLAVGLRSEDKLLRARTCMALEIISRDHPELLTNVGPQLIAVASQEKVPQVRWHIAEVWANVPVAAKDVDQVVTILLDWLRDKSVIVRYCAVQALGVLGGSSSAREEVVRRIDAMRGQSKSLDKAVARASATLSGNEMQ